MKEIERYEILLKVYEKFEKEVEECYKNQCYLASMILYGAVLEAILLAMCFAYEDDVKSISEKEILNLNLSALIEIAEKLNWLPLKEKIGSIGEFEQWVNWIKATRNLVHPARWIKEEDENVKYFIEKVIKGIKKKEFEKFIRVSKETVEVIRKLFLNKIEKDIAKEIKNG